MLAWMLLAALSAGAAGAPGQFLSQRRGPGNESAPGDVETAPLARSLESEWKVDWGSTCGGLGDLLGDSDCGEAAADAFSGLLETAGALLSGKKLDQDAWNDLATGSIAGLGAILGATIPFPVSMLSQLVIPLVSGMHGQLTAAAAKDSSASYVALQQLFRQSMKRNGARYQALVDEWEWFKTLRNQTLNNNGALYEAAALSWLLNVQHDLAIQQESFFNVECLQMLDKSRFANISDGRCEEIGLAPISDVAMCDVAGHHLKGLSLDVNDNVGRIYNQSRPQGCYWYDESSPHDGAYVNLHPDSAATEANEVRQSLCTSVSRESQAECAAWHEADTWQVSQWYAVLHLLILTDIYSLYPALQETTLKRVSVTGAEYILLLTHSFKSSLEKRKAHLKKPQVNDIGAFDWRCSFAPIDGPKVRLTEGRDYYHQKLTPQEGAVVDDDNDDGKCRGACDVLSSRCRYRLEKSGEGDWYSKYCVSESVVAAAEDCWVVYRDEVVSNFTALFDNEYMKNLRSLRATALQQLQSA